MKSFMYLLLCLAIASCNSQSQGNEEHASTRSTIANEAHSEKFDLAILKLNENLTALMTINGIKGEPKAEADQTLIGFEVFRTSDPKALHFENVDLVGSNGVNKNHVLFHYSEDQHTLAFYEVILYNQKQIDVLINTLGKVGTMVFKQTKLSEGAIEIDENGNATKGGSGSSKTFRVWENKTAGLSYFLMSEGSGQTFTSRLVVLKRSEKSGKDWISTHSLDWYENVKSESF